MSSFPVIISGAYFVGMQDNVATLAVVRFTCSQGKVIILSQEGSLFNNIIA